MTTATRELGALRQEWRGARARLFLGVAQVLQAAVEEQRLNSAAQQRGESWLSFFGQPPIDEKLGREIEFWCLAQGVDGLGVVRGVHDPHEADASKWWNDPAVLDGLRRIAGENGKVKGR